MVTGGRILHHLAQRLPDPKNTVIFIGFQAPGTRGVTIKSGAPEVRIFGETVTIRAQIEVLEQFSDHADTPELLDWLRTFSRQALVSRIWCTANRRLVPAARCDDEGTGMERAGGGMDGESGCLISGALMTEGELKKYLEAAEKSPKQVAAAVSGLPEKTLRYKPSPEKWSILEILGHLADIEIVYAYRLRQMLADKKPVIAPIDQNDWARNLGHMDTPPAELIALYGLNRHANLRLLQRLKAADLAKSAFHPETKKEFTVAELVERMATHGASHLEQIERLKREAKG